MPSIQTPPPMLDSADEYPTSPLNEENVNLLLGPDEEEDIEDPVIQVVGEVYNDGGQQQAEQEVQEMSPPPPPSSSGEPVASSCPPLSPTTSRGEPTKENRPSASPARTTPGWVENTITLDSPQILSPEILPKLQPILFDWADAVQDPEAVDKEIIWLEKERVYLQRLEEFETFRRNVILALGEITPDGQLAKRRHQSPSPDQQEDAQRQPHGSLLDEEDVQDVPVDQRDDREARDIQRGAQRDSLKPSGDREFHSDNVKCQPPAKKVRSDCKSADHNSDWNQGSPRTSSGPGPQDPRTTAGPNTRPTDLKSISRIFRKQESIEYIQEVSAFLNKVKHAVSKFNPDIVTELNKGSDRNKFRLIEHVGKHLNVMRDEPELLQFLTTKNLLNLPIDNYEYLVTFPSLLNISPSTRTNVLSIYNFCYIKEQSQYQRNRFIKMVLSLCCPKLAACVMVLQGDQLANDLLKNIFSKQSNIWVQVLHYNLLIQATYAYDLSRGRTFFSNKTKEIFLPANITSAQFQQKLYLSREIAWTRSDFELFFHSKRVSSPLRDLDNLHLSELQFIKKAMSHSRSHFF